jgi:hypothetical protein
VRWRRRFGTSPQTVEALVDHLSTHPDDSDPHRQERDAGTLAGLTTTGNARIRPEAGEDGCHFAGYLTGHLLKWLVDRGRPLDGDAICVATYYGAPIGDGAAQRRLDEPAANVRWLHTYLMIYLERKLGRPADVELESQLVSWLCSQLRVRPATDDIGALLGRMRVRRLAKYFPDATPGDGTCRGSAEG